MDINAPAIGVKITPEALDNYVRSSNDYAIHCDKGVPDNYKLTSYGFNPDWNAFYLIFQIEDCPEGVNVKWVEVTFIGNHIPQIEIWRKLCLSLLGKNAERFSR